MACWGPSGSTPTNAAALIPLRDTTEAEAATRTTTAVRERPATLPTVGATPERRPGAPAALRLVKRLAARAEALVLGVSAVTLAPA